MMPTCGELDAMEGRPDLATAKGSGIIGMALGKANRGANRAAVGQNTASSGALRGLETFWLPKACFNLLEGLRRLMRRTAWMSRTPVIIFFAPGLLRVIAA